MTSHYVRRLHPVKEYLRLPLNAGLEHKLDLNRKIGPDSDLENKHAEETYRTLRYKIVNPRRRQKYRR